MCVGINGPDDPDLLTLKLVSKSHLKWGTLLPNLGMLALWVLELFAVYATDGQMDGQTDKSNSYYPLPYVGSIIITALALTAAVKHREASMIILSR